MAKRPVIPGQDVNRLDLVIQDLGVRVCIYKSTLCPNMKSLESDDHDLNCTICDHRMIDFDPIPSYALFQQQQMMEQFKLTGTFNIDEVMVTFLTGITIQSMARIDLVDFPEDFYELIQRQEGTDKDKLKYPATCVTALFTVSSNTKTRYFPDSDFIIDMNGNIEWTGAHRPDAREVYSIYYRHIPVYRAIKAIHRDRYTQLNVNNKLVTSKVEADGRTFIKMPETWVLMRSNLQEKQDVNGVREFPNTYYDPNEDLTP